MTMPKRNKSEKIWGIMVIQKSVAHLSVGGIPIVEFLDLF